MTSKSKWKGRCRGEQGFVILFGAFLVHPAYITCAGGADGQHINRVINTEYHALSLMGACIVCNVTSPQSHSSGKGGQSNAGGDRHVCGLDGGSGSCVVLQS